MLFFPRQQCNIEAQANNAGKKSYGVARHTIAQASCSVADNLVQGGAWGQTNHKSPLELLHQSRQRLHARNICPGIFRTNRGWLLPMPEGNSDFTMLLRQ